MLKTLKNKSKKKILAKIKFKDFLKKKLWQYIVVITFIIFCAWLFNKPFEAILFCISHIVIRRNFDKQYHCTHTIGAIATCLCLTLTLTIIFFGIAYCLPMTISLLSTIPICWVISYFGYIAQERIDFAKEIKRLKSKTIWQMSETELRDYLFLKGIRGEKIDFVVMVVVHELSYDEISYKMGYCVDTLKQWSRKCKAKLNIKSWKQ